MQSTYQIIGLSKQEVVRHSYKTDDNIRIIHDENGKGISIQKPFSQYVLYIGSVGDACYSITLSESDMASYGGKLGHLGSMDVMRVSQLDAQKNITHAPVKPLHICADLGENQREELAQVFDDYPEKMNLLRIMEENSFIEEINVRLSGEPTTTVFSFSNDGGDERTPCGYVYLNMELFTPLQNA